MLTNTFYNITNKLKISLFNNDVLFINKNDHELINYIDLNHKREKDNLFFLRIVINKAVIENIAERCPNLILMHHGLTNNNLSKTSSSKLTKLDLSWCHDINNQTLKVTHFVNLTQLNLNSTDGMPQELIELKNLTDYSASVRAGYEEFTQLTNLIKLNFKSYPELLDKLALFPKLTHLTLTPIESNRSDFSKIYEFTNLTHLALHDFKSFNDFESISKLTKLSSLNIHVSDISDAGFMSIGKLTNLTCLHFQHFSRKVITEENLYFTCGLTNLTDLKFLSLTDIGIEKLTKLTQLKAIDVRHFNISNENFKQLASMTNLTDLTMDEFRKNNDFKCFKMLTNLTAISFMRIPPSYAELKVLTLCPNLSAIKFKNIQRIAGDDLKKFTVEHPNILITKSYSR